MGINQLTDLPQLYCFLKNLYQYMNTILYMYLDFIYLFYFLF